MTSDILSESPKQFAPPVFLRRNKFDYESTYDASLENPSAFWGALAEQLLWETKWSKVFEFDPPKHEWFVGAKTNITLNALDRHIVGERRNKVALIWSSESGHENYVTFDRLIRRVSQVANAMKSVGIKKGDAVLIFMPNVVEAVYAMLACARLGAIHAVIHEKAGARALKSRIEDIQPKLVFCADACYAEGTHFPMKSVLNDALRTSASVEKIVVLRRQMPKLRLTSEREVDFYDFVSGQAQFCNPEIVESSHPLFALYTSSTSGKPKGVVHDHGGYMVGAYYAAKTLMDIQDNDVLWNAFHVGSAPGHLFSVYGTLLAGATILMHEGAIDYPNAEAFWRRIERHGVNMLVAHPSLLRQLRARGAEAMKKYDNSTLRLILTTGGALAPDLHEWAQKEVVGKIGSVIEAWLQNEIPIPVIGNSLNFPVRLGKVGKAMPGATFETRNLDGSPAPPNQEGLLVLSRPVPFLMKTIWNNEERYNKYWRHVERCFNTGDLATRDEQGYFKIVGRIDDVMKVSGYRIAYAEVEATLCEHPLVEEAAVIGLPDSAKGEKIKAFVVLKARVNASDSLKAVLRDYARHELGELVAPDEIEFRAELPRQADGGISHQTLKAESQEQSTAASRRS